MCSISSFCWLSVLFHFRHCLSLRHWLHALFLHNYHNHHWWKCYHQKLFATINSHSSGVPAYSFSPIIILFSFYFCFLVSHVKLTIRIPQSKYLISAGLGSKLSQVLIGNIFYDSFPFFFTIIIMGCYERILWKCYSLWSAFHSFSNWFQFVYKTFF